MAKKRKPKAPPPRRPEKRPEPRLYLFAPPLAEAGGFPALLEEVLSEVDVACVVAMANGAAPAALRALLLALAPVAARHGAALLSGEPEMVNAAGTDGVHTRGAGSALDAALAALKPGFIVGASDARTRHDAMEVGERDIDYLMYGDPAPDGWTPPMEETLERVSWWAEIFNIPCVAFAPRLEDVGPLVAAGADFIALGAAVWDDPRGPVTAAREAEDRAVAAMADA